MPRKKQATRKKLRHHRAYSSSSSPSYSSSLSSDFQTSKPVPVGTNPTTPPQDVQAKLPPFSILHLNIHSTQNVQMKSRSAYCKVFVASTPMVENTMFAGLSGTQYQTFKTNSVQVNSGQPEWNSTFEIRINDPRVDMLSILVKNQQLLYCPIIGVCVINMKILMGAQSVDKWFALRKGPFQIGHIRLQMLLEKIEQSTISPRVQAPFVDCDAAPVDRPTLENQSPPIQSNPVRWLDDGYQQRKKEKRRLRELKEIGRKQHKRRENDDQFPEKEASLQNNSGRFASPSDYREEADTLYHDADQVSDLVHSDKSQQAFEVRSGRSGSRSSHGSGESGNIRENLKPCKVHSSGPSSVQSSGKTQRRASDNELYGEISLEEKEANAAEDGDFTGTNGDYESMPDSGFSSSSSSDSSNSRQHRRKQKKKRRAHRRRKHRHAQEAFPQTTIPTEIPTYPSSAPIGVLPPPPPSSNPIPIGKLATVASRVASIALHGADYTKAFTNVADNHAAASAVANAAVLLEGIPIASEDIGSRSNSELQHATEQIRKGIGSCSSCTC